MRRRFPGLLRSIAVGGFLVLTAPPARAQSIALRPVDSTAAHVIDGNHITTAPGSIVTLEVHASGWGLAAGSPQLIGVQASFDPAGFLGTNADPANPGVDLLPLGYEPPDPVGGNRALGLYVATHNCSINGRNCSVGEAPCQANEGFCLSNSRWVVNTCCPLALVSTDSLSSYGLGGACQCGAVPDPENDERGYVGTLRLQIPANAKGLYAIPMKPDDGGGDGTYMVDPFNIPIPGVALLSATLQIVPSPQLPPPPHDIEKNRFVSFVPASGAVPVAHQIRIVSNTLHPTAGSYSGWIAAPSTSSGTTSRIVSTPVFRIWSEPVIHGGDCEILPGASYEIRSTPDGITYSAPIVVNTTAKPAGGKDWGDIVGFNNGTQWTPPNGFANVQDVVAVRNYVTGVAPIPTAQRVNLQAISARDSCLNDIVNTADVQAAVFAINGANYPFITDPLLCPDCPS